MADGDYERIGPRQAELARFKRILAAARQAEAAAKGRNVASQADGAAHT